MEREEWESLVRFDARVVNALGHYGTVVRWSQNSVQGLQAIWVSWDHLSVGNTRQITWHSAARIGLQLAWDAFQVYEELRSPREPSLSEGR